MTVLMEPWDTRRDPAVIEEELAESGRGEAATPDVGEAQPASGGKAIKPPPAHRPARVPKRFRSSV
jgi:hypothetical protein